MLLCVHHPAPGHTPTTRCVHSKLEPPRFPRHSNTQKIQIFKNSIFKPGALAGEQHEIIAHPDFRVLATMNPGGDYGKVGGGPTGLLRRSLSAISVGGYRALSMALTGVPERPR
jgi:hypothetical protein